MCTDVLGDTPLHEAVRFSDLDEVYQALKEGYDPNELGAYLWSPLHEACNNGDAEIVKILLQYKGDPDVKDSLRGCTAVHYAASQEHVQCLKLLLSAGGQYHIVNKDGQSAFDVAVGACRELLQEKCGKSFNNYTNVTDKKKQNILEDSSSSTTQVSCYKSDKDHDSPGCGSKDHGYQDSLIDMDQISIDSGGSSCGHQRCGSWGFGEVVKMNNNQVLGNIQLSFEYNSKKSTLKIRVWKVVDLLMPPSNTSMIQGLYVKSYLQPDKRKQTKRKTEEIKVEMKSAEISGKAVQSGSEIFKPSSFSFSKSLEYENVTLLMISSRNISLEVCITQKYTHRSFTIATWSMPLKQAVKRVLKEMYSLKACISTTIPEHMKVYNATTLDVVKSRGFGSNPSLICRRSEKWTDECQERSVSNPDLNQVSVERSGKKPPSIEITVPEMADLELEDALQQIIIMEKNSDLAVHDSAIIDLDKGRSSSAMSLSDSVASDDSNMFIEGVKVEQSINIAQVEIHVSDKDLNDSTGKLKLAHFTEESDRMKKKGWLDTIHTPRDSHMSDSVAAVHRPETPSWDYYSEPLECTVAVVSSNQEFNNTTAKLPMAVTLDLPEVHSSFIPRCSDEKTVAVDIPRLSSVGKNDHCRNEP